MHSDLVGKKRMAMRRLSKHNTARQAANCEPTRPLIEQGKRECDSTADRDSVGAGCYPDAYSPQSPGHVLQNHEV